MARFRHRQPGARGVGLRLGLVERLAAEGAAFGQRMAPREVVLCLLRQCARLVAHRASLGALLRARPAAQPIALGLAQRELRARQRHRGEELGVLDFGQDLALGHRVAFGEGDAREAAADLGDQHAFLAGGLDQARGVDHGPFASGGLRGGAGAAGGEQQGDGGRRQAHGRIIAPKR